jgi:hypothetical protein
MSTTYICKSKLAGVLSSTKRTVSNYVNTGVLPPPQRFGRDSGWYVDVLMTLLNSEQSSLRQLSEQQRSRLAKALSQFETSSGPNGEVISEIGESASNKSNQWRLPEPVFVDASFNLERDLRRFHIDEVKSFREQADSLVRQAHQAAKGSDEKSERWNEVHKLNEHIDCLEGRLANDFIHLHGPSQFLGNRELLTSPIFNIRNPKSPRSGQVEILLNVRDVGNIKYQGPELRQDDCLVFMALLNIARDVRVGKSVGFSPRRVCESLWGYYDGAARSRLKTTISRLQSAILQFPTFRVQLVQRFDFPQSGLWSVSLDTDIAQLFTKHSVVWLDQSQRHSLKNGLATWLYGYIRSQTTLMPTKVEHLRVQCGSGGALDGFRESLKVAMGVMSGEQLVDIGWHIDKHDMLHWLKLGS